MRWRMTEARPSHPLWALYETLAMGIGLGSLAVLCLLWLPVAMLLYPVLPRPLARRLGRRANSLGLRIYLRLLRWFCACRFDLAELDTLRDAGPLILAANHPSLLDAVLILSRLPDTVCVMKASLMDNILFGAAARLARYIRNDPPLTMILRCRDELEAGTQLLIFPEGTRTTDFPLDPCQPTIGLIAKRANVPVQTLLIEYSSPYLGKSWPLFRRPRLPLHCRVRLGQRLAPSADLAEFTGALETSLRSELTPAPATSA
jgi:1-acyl-sn-glycerol-3-phosphate acyltransferase